jgi:RNA polymerase sigma-70 factor (sigma-E family)
MTAHEAAAGAVSTTEPVLSRLGRDEAVTLLFRAHHRRLIGLARLLVDDLATSEDVVQDAFAALYRRWRWLRDKEAAVTYLDHAVVNAARSQLRRRRVRAGVRWVPQPAVLDSAEAQAVRGDEQRRLVSALATIPTRQREVLVLRYFLDRTESEIAETLGISRGSVKQHASRGLAALNHRMEPGS